MPDFSQLRETLNSLKKRDQVIGIVTVAVVLILGANLLLLKPQRLVLDRLKVQEQANQSELASILKQISDLDQLAKTGSLFAAERAALAEYQRQIAEVDAFFVQSDPTLGQVGGLVRRMIREDPRLTLVTLKMLPSSVFYSPPVAPVQQENAISSVLQSVKKAPPAPVILTERTLYKHGVEVIVKGSYPALVAYMERVQSFPKRLFWSEAIISVPRYPETTLKLVIFSLSDEAMLPLN